MDVRYVCALFWRRAEDSRSLRDACWHPCGRSLLEEWLVLLTTSHYSSPCFVFFVHSTVFYVRLWFGVCFPSSEDRNFLLEIPLVKVLLIFSLHLKTSLRDLRVALREHPTPRCRLFSLHPWGLSVCSASFGNLPVRLCYTLSSPLLCCMFRCGPLFCVDSTVKTFTHLRIHSLSPF